MDVGLAAREEIRITIIKEREKTYITNVTGKDIVFPSLRYNNKYGIQMFKKVGLHEIISCMYADGVGHLRALISRVILRAE